jgi:hypothetical protein
VDEARAILERLKRIEALDREGAPPPTLLVEVRELLREGEAWLQSEHEGSELAAEALHRIRRLHEGAEHVT